MDGDNNDATSIVPTGPIVCSRVRVDRMFTVIERKIETLGLLNEIREFPQKIVTNAPLSSSWSDTILHPCQFSNNNELIAIRKAFCYPFCSHLAIFQARVFESFFSITCSRDEDHRYQSICMYIHIYLIFDEERICPILFAKKKIWNDKSSYFECQKQMKGGGITYGTVWQRRRWKTSACKWNISSFFFFFFSFPSFPLLLFSIPRASNDTS